MAPRRTPTLWWVLPLLCVLVILTWRPWTPAADPSGELHSALLGRSSDEGADLDERGRRLLALHSDGFSRVPSAPWLHGVVVDPDGRGVANSQVLLIATAEGVQVTTTTGPDGSFAISAAQVPDLAGQDAVFRLSAVASGWLSTSLEIDGYSLPRTEPVRVHLRTGLAVQVVCVREPDGEVIAGVPLEAVADATTLEQTGSRSEGISDTDGSAWLTVAGPGWITVSAFAGGMYPGWTDSFLVSEAGQTLKMTLPAVLPRLHIRAVDMDSGAALKRVQYQEFRWAAGEQPQYVEVRAGAAGELHYQPPSDQSSALMVGAPSYQPVLVFPDTWDGESEDIQVVELDALRELPLQILEGGQPVAAAVTWSWTATLERSWRARPAMLPGSLLEHARVLRRTRSNAGDDGMVTLQVTRHLPSRIHVRTPSGLSRGLRFDRVEIETLPLVDGVWQLDVAPFPLAAVELVLLDADLRPVPNQWFWLSATGLLGISQAQADVWRASAPDRHDYDADFERDKEAYDLLSYSCWTDANGRSVVHVPLGSDVNFSFDKTLARLDATGWRPAIDEREREDVHGKVTALNGNQCTLYLDSAVGQGIRGTIVGGRAQTPALDFLFAGPLRLDAVADGDWGHPAQAAVAADGSFQIQVPPGRGYQLYWSDRNQRFKVPLDRPVQAGDQDLSLQLPPLYSYLVVFDGADYCSGSVEVGSINSPIDPTQRSALLGPFLEPATGLVLHPWVAGIAEGWLPLPQPKKPGILLVNLVWGSGRTVTLDVLYPDGSAPPFIDMQGCNPGYGPQFLVELGAWPPYAASFRFRDGRWQWERAPAEAFTLELRFEGYRARVDFSRGGDLHQTLQLEGRQD